MFEDFIAEVKNQEKGILLAGGEKSEGIEEVLIEITKLEIRKKDILNSITNFKKAILTIQKLIVKVSSWVVNKIKESNEDKRLLFESLKIAIKNNPEYDHPFFKTGLISAINDPRTIRLTPLENGDVFVKVDLNLTAGSIHDYASAVKKIRNEIKKASKVKKLSPQYQRDKFWEEKFYRPAREGGNVSRRKFNRDTEEYEERDVTVEQVQKYWNTLTKRQAAWGKSAPYWELLDKGIAAMPGAGNPYPVPKATNFVEVAIPNIKMKCKEDSAEQTGYLKEDLRNTEETVTKLELEVAAIEELIQKLKSNLTPEALLLRRIEAYGREYSRDKLTKLLKALHIRNLGGISVTAEGRVEITAPGEPRFRISIVGLINKFNFEW